MKVFMQNIIEHLDRKCLYLFYGRSYLGFSKNYDSTSHGVRVYSRFFFRMVIYYTWQWDDNAECRGSCEPRTRLQVRNPGVFNWQSPENDSSFGVFQVSEWIFLDCHEEFLGFTYTDVYKSFIWVLKIRAPKSNEATPKSH